MIPAPACQEGEGRIERPNIRIATMFDGTAAPPIGPVELGVEDNRISDGSLIKAKGVESSSQTVVAEEVEFEED